MSEKEIRTVSLYRSDPKEPANVAAFAVVTAPKIILVSNYADLRDEDDSLIATITWKSPVTARMR